MPKRLPFVLHELEKGGIAVCSEGKVFMNYFINNIVEIKSQTYFSNIFFPVIFLSNIGI